MVSDLGFYFRFLIKNSSYFSTRVMVKSNVGATEMAVYSLDDPDFDTVFRDGTLPKKIPVFYVPILFHQRFNNRWYIEAGPQLGLIHQCVDIFEASKLDGDLKFTLDVRISLNILMPDFWEESGISLGKVKGMAVGINYYYGLVNVSDNPDIKIKNSAIYFYIKIPIGVGKAKE